MSTIDRFNPFLNQRPAEVNQRPLSPAGVSFEPQKQSVGFAGIGNPFNKEIFAGLQGRTANGRSFVPEGALGDNAINGKLGRNLNLFA